MFNTTAFQCDFCHKVSKNKNTIRSHEKKCFGNPERKACQTCAKLCFDKQSNCPDWVINPDLVEG